MIEIAVNSTHCEMTKARQNLQEQLFISPLYSGYLRLAVTGTVEGTEELILRL